MRSWTRPGFGIVLAGALAACATPPEEGPARVPAVCANLANSFYLVAEQMNRGVSKEAQIATAERATRKPGKEALRRHWLQVIELVYRFPDGTADEIGFTVLDRCTVGERGQAVVTTIWPGG